MVYHALALDIQFRVIKPIGAARLVNTAATQVARLADPIVPARVRELS